MSLLKITAIRSACSVLRLVAYCYVYDFGTKNLARLTNSLNPEINPNDLVEGGVVRYKSSMDWRFPRFFTHRTAPARKKCPRLCGSRWARRTGAHALQPFDSVPRQPWLRRAGRQQPRIERLRQDIFHRGRRKHGREPFWDCVEAKKYLASLGYVDESKIGIMGGSYGGYMVLAALAFKPEEFGAGVDIFGVSNWVRTLQSIPPYWESQRKALYKEIGDPTAQEEMLKEISPLFHADKITKPLIVLQGANDPRVIKPESDEIVDAVKKKNGIVEYVIFDNEGHGFTKKANEIRAYKAILDFLDKYLKGKVGS